MNNQFIPSFHYDAPSTKLSPAWMKKALNYCWYNSNNTSLLNGKNLREIEQYANGEYDLTPFVKLHKSAKKQAIEQGKGKSVDVNDDVLYSCVPLLPTKLNSAEATVQKIPIEIAVTALDPLAADKKKEDLQFLKNKPMVENRPDLQEIADKLQMEKIDLGTTKHSSVPYSEAPYDLDLTEPDELQVFTDLVYALSEEEAFETLLQILHNNNKLDQVKYLMAKDHFRYGIAACQTYQNGLTGLPSTKYKYCGNILAPHSDLQDYSDNTHRFIHERVTPLELFNYFADEIGTENKLEGIVNGGIGGLPGMGWCACNVGKNGRGEATEKPTACPRSNWDSMKMDLIYCEIISVDRVDVVQKTMGSDVYEYLSADTSKDNQENVTGQIWGQNTYGFWWLANTDHYFGVHKLGWAHRKAGLESFTSFSTDIYKSQNKGCVELAIPENKRAQVAYIKMMYALIMSLPAGKVIDLKGLRSALRGLKADKDNEYTLDMLIDMAFTKNQIIIDSEGFDGKNDGQLKPFYEIPGGLKTEITGYIQIMRDADMKISQYTGINEALTGQSASPDALIGLEKLRINQSLNALYYVTAGLEQQYQAVFNTYGSLIKKGVEMGGDVKKAIINMIGSQKVAIIDGLEDLPLHTMGIKISIKQREEEREQLKEALFILKQQGVITAGDEYQLSVIQNPKDRFRYLAVKEKQFRKRAEQQQQQQQAAQQQMVQQQGQNMVAAQQAKTQGEKENIYAKGDVQANLVKLASSLGMHASQFQAMVQRGLDQAKQEGQIRKSLATLETKHNLENQAAL